MDKKSNGFVVAASVAAVAVIIALVLGLVTYRQNAQIDSMTADIDTLSEKMMQLDSDLTVANNNYASQLEYTKQLTKTISDKDTEIKNKDSALSKVQADLAAVKVQLEAQEEMKTEKEDKDTRDRYEEDDLDLGDGFSFDVTDRELKSLIDDEIDFEGENYDIDEKLTVGGEIGINDEDFAEEVYLKFDKDDIIYKVIFENSLESEDDITDDQVLTFKFLGEDVDVSDWDGNSITFTKGNQYIITEGDSIEVEGRTITATIINDDYVYFLVSQGDDMDSKKISEGITDDVLGLEIFVDSVLDNEALEQGQGDMAVIKIGKEVEEEIKNGDDYDDTWEWVVSEYILGLTLNEKFTDLDKENAPLAFGDQLCLPNDYLCVQFVGITDETTEDYTIEYDSDVTYLRGDIQVNGEDYDEIYWDATNIFDEDDEIICTIASGTVVLGDTDLELSFNGRDVEIEDLYISYLVDDIQVDGTSIDDSDNYRTPYGIIIDSPEDSLDDQEVDFSVPEEALKGIVAVLA